MASFSASRQNSASSVFEMRQASTLRVNQSTPLGICCAKACRAKDGHQIEEALAHGQVGDVGAPDLIGPIDPQPAQQVGIGLVPLRGLAGVGLLVDRQ
jgi:hypothetical protein